MNYRYFMRKYIFTAIFFIVLFGFFGYYMYTEFSVLYATVIESADWDGMSDAVDDEIEDDFPLQKFFVEFYGLQNLLLDKKEDNASDIVKDQDGVLYYDAGTLDHADTDVLAADIYTLQQHLKDTNTKVLAFIMPDKYNKDIGNYYEGIPYRDSNSLLDAYAASLEQYNISYYDFRNTIENSGLSVSDLFFKTDHHWNIEAAFLAYQDCVTYFKNTYGEDLDPDGIYTNIDNYNIETYPSAMLGSLGRKTGVLYAGLDDLTVMIPKFETDYTVTQTLQKGDNSIERTGAAEYSLYVLNNLATDSVYNRNSYSVFTEGIADQTQILNTLNPNGPKVLMILDSYSYPLNIFLAESCSEIDAYWIDDLDDSEDIEKIIADENYDYVIVSTYVDSLDESYFSYLDNE